MIYIYIPDHLVAPHLRNYYFYVILFNKKIYTRVLLTLSFFVFIMIKTTATKKKILRSTITTISQVCDFGRSVKKIIQKYHRNPITTAKYLFKDETWINRIYKKLIAPFWLFCWDYFPGWPWCYGPYEVPFASL